MTISFERNRRDLYDGSLMRTASSGLDWRRPLIYTHRWLGIAGCLLFIAWFASGIVMMYARMPSLSAEERLARLQRLDLAAARVSPAQIISREQLAATGMRVAMLHGRPVYRIATGRREVAAFGDTGELVQPSGAGAAVAIARDFFPEHTATIAYGARLLDSDQWTLSSAIRSLMPLHRIDIGDSAGTELYVAEPTGEPVLKTTHRGRVWGYLGAVIHWIYFTPFRRHAGLWAQSIIWVSIVGSLMCLTGLVWGAWRFSPIGRFRLKRQLSHSPYAGMMLWHHYAGLIFGLTTFTWILSGLLSMDPWNWHPGTAPTRQQREAMSGGPLRTDLLTIDRLRASVAAMSSSFVPSEVELLQFAGDSFLVAYRPPATVEDHAWIDTDRAPFLSPQRAEQRIVALAAPEHGTFSRFPDARVAAVARTAIPDQRIAEESWLERYDPYYYDRHGALALPVLRLRYADARQTWLYVDPFRGAIARKEERSTRVNRWLYHGLHSLDFPFLYYRRPLWDCVLIVLSLGGVVSSVTAITPALRRFRRHLRRVFPREETSARKSLP
jgi:hypothetical protein